MIAHAKVGSKAFSNVRASGEDAEWWLGSVRSVVASVPVLLSSV